VKLFFKDLPLQLKEGGVSWSGLLVAAQRWSLRFVGDELVPGDQTAWQSCYSFNSASNKEPGLSSGRVVDEDVELDWAADVEFRHEDRAWFEDGDFRQLLKPETVDMYVSFSPPVFALRESSPLSSGSSPLDITNRKRRAELDQRTSQGRCKKVVAYRKGLAYGNDLMGQKIESWRPELLENFTMFIETLLPQYKFILV
jgi:hypothetical protein